MIKALLALVCLVSIGAQADTRHRFAGEDGTERVFSKIHSVNQMEIQLAQLALTKSQDQDIRAYAQMMIDDHTQADQKLVVLAQQENLDLRNFVPKSAKEIRQDQEDQATTQELQMAAEPQFDQMYIDAMVDGHAKVLSWLKAKRDMVDGKDARMFVKMTTQTVRHHWMMARDLQKR